VEEAEKRTHDRPKSPSRNGIGKPGTFSNEERWTFLDEEAIEVLRWREKMWKGREGMSEEEGKEYGGWSQSWGGRTHFF